MSFQKRNVIQFCRWSSDSDTVTFFSKIKGNENLKLILVTILHDWRHYRGSLKQDVMIFSKSPEKTNGTLTINLDKLVALGNGTLSLDRLDASQSSV